MQLTQNEINAAAERDQERLAAQQKRPIMVGTCEYCHAGEGNLRFVCAECEEKEAHYDITHMDLRLAAMEVLRLLPRMKEAGVPGVLRGKLHTIFIDHLKAYLPKRLAEHYEEEVAEKIRAGVEDAS